MSAKNFLRKTCFGLAAMLAGATDAGAMLLGSANYFGTLGVLGYSREHAEKDD